MKQPALVPISFVVLLLAGCSMAPSGTATPKAPAVASPSAAPSMSAPPATTPSSDPSRPPEPTFAVPRGFLASGTTSVEGWMGSYCWQNTCVDIYSFPPKAELPEITADDDPLEFSLSDGATFSRWTVSYGDDSDSELIILEQGGAPSDPDAQPQSGPPELTNVEFDSPPGGDWFLTVSVQFPGGDLSYAWHVLVE